MEIGICEAHSVSVGCPSRFSPTLQHGNQMKIRAILQSESAECGLACIAMIANHHGFKTSLRELRQQFPISMKGSNLTQLIAIADKIGFQCRAVRLELEDLRKLKLPCVLHWDMNHFVTLVRVTAEMILVIDPAYGERRLSYKEVSPRFTGIALELTPGANFNSRNPGSSISLRQLTGSVSGLWKSLTLVLALSFGLQICVSIAPLLLQVVIDQVLVSADLSLLATLAIGFCLLMLLQVATGLFRGLSVIYLSNSIGIQWAGNVFAYLLRLPLDFFEKRHLGDITSRLGSISSIQRTLTTSFVEVVIDGVMAIITLAMMLVYSIKLSIVTLFAVAIYLVLRAILYQEIRRRTEEQLVAAANQESHLLESIRGIQSVKIACCEPQRKSIYFNLLSETIGREADLAKFNLGFNSLSQLIFGIERIIVLSLGAVFALDGAFSAGMLIAYLAYKEQFSHRAGGLIDKWVELRMLKLHAERLSDIVLAKPEADDARLMPRIHLNSKRIEIENISFRYGEEEPLVIQGLSLAVEPGESVAVIGPSGCGKTTLVKIMLGLLSASSGEVKFGGVNISRIGSKQYRAMVGAVMQDDQLFAGSIADNICFGFDECDMERVEKAAKLAFIHSEIMAMPMTYQTLVGDMGAALSGGQKQRVILARALYRNPQILFLDEATSHLDIENERLVSRAIRGLRLTRIIVAHRPETIASADRIIEIRNGKIVQSYQTDARQAEAPAERQWTAENDRWDSTGAI